MMWESAYSARTDLHKFGSNGLGLFALALRFGLDDLETVAAESLMDGNDDKKLDFVYIDRDSGFAVIAQCYQAKKPGKASAPANKAADLNTGIAWLLRAELSSLPEKLRPSAEDLRGCLDDGSINELYLWYIHNLPESANVRTELGVAEGSLNSALREAFPRRRFTTHVYEIGTEKLEALYQDTQSPILVNNTFRFKIDNGFEITGGTWTAYVTAISARFLYDTYRTHKSRLFSANVRDYLGSRSSDANINNSIKSTVASDPADFWVFNNGLTLLVNSYQLIVEGNKKQLEIKGLSVVNGAQTTGAIGSLNRPPKKTAMVPVRFVQTANTETIFNIIQYNNSQNKITAADFRSRDRVQKRLRLEFEKIPEADYQGGRRGGHADVIKRNPRLLPSYTVGQALAAVNQDPVVASNQKSDIWADDRLYSKYFGEETTAPHIVFCYSLLRAVEERKIGLVTKSKADQCTLTENRELEFFRNRGATFLLVSAIASSLETILKRKIPKVSHLSFGTKCSPNTAEKIWGPIVEVVAPFSDQLREAFTHGLKNEEKVGRTLQTFQALVQSSATITAPVFKTFSKRVRSKN